MVSTDKYSLALSALQQVHYMDISGSIGNWGSNTTITSGTSDGQFSSPLGVFVDNNGYIYVTDTNNNRIQLFTNDGILMGWLGTSGSGDGWWPATPNTGETASGSGWFNSPTQVAVDSSGNRLFVCNQDSSPYDTIEVFARFHF